MLATTGLTYRPLFRDLSGSFLPCLLDEAASLQALNCSSPWSDMLGPSGLSSAAESEAVQLSFVSSNPWKLKSEVEDEPAIECQLIPKTKTPMKTDFWSKKFRQMGEAAWPEVPIAFCLIYFFQDMHRTC